MPDMRDAIAQYLAAGRPPLGVRGQGITGYGNWQPMPQGIGGGMPNMGPPATGQPINPVTGQPYPGNVDPMPPPGPNPGGPVPPPPPEFYNGGRDIFAPDPSVPSNLQGYEQLPSGQFLPGGQRPGFPTVPNQGVGYEGLGGTGPTTGGYPMPSQGMPDDISGIPQTPPVNTPMQAPPPPIVQDSSYGGMDPRLRMFRGG